MYNGRAYHERGWCVEEDGVVRVVLAHTAAAEKRGQLQVVSAIPAGRLPTKYASAAAARPKLLDISELGKPREVTVDERPQELMRTLGEKLANAKFTNEADRPTVRRLVHDFEWLVMRSIADAEMGADAPATSSRRRSVAAVVPVEGDPAVPNVAVIPPPRRSSIETIPLDQ